MLDDTLRINLPDEDIDHEIAAAHKAARGHLSDYWKSLFRCVYYLRVRKERVGHGNWQAWKRDHLKELGISSSTAEHWMLIVSRLDQCPELKPQVVGMSERAALRFVTEAFYRRHERRRRIAATSEKKSEKRTDALKDARNEIHGYALLIADTALYIANNYPHKYHWWLSKLPISDELVEHCLKRTGLYQKIHSGAAKMESGDEE